MGNGFSPCITCSSKSSVKLVFWEGTTKTLTGKRLAGEVMFQFPDSIVCHADSFYIGQRIPSLSIDDELVKGQTYFVLPVDRFACQVLSAASLAAMASTPKRTPLSFGECPFEHIKGPDGRVLIKVLPDFITRIISRGNDEQGCNNPTSPLCSTPELQKHYAQLVGSKEQVWSPKLETIAECKTRLSPCRLLGLEWRSEKLHG